MSPTLHIPIGIDLGTTFSVVAFLDDSGRPSIVPNNCGEFLTPSALYFDNDEIKIGRDAVRSSLIDPSGYADCFKRDMGDKYYRQKIRGAAVPPEVLSGILLRELKAFAERRLGSTDRAVITVPAFFDETRRQCTCEAARLANLGVLDIINEPTAAAVAYAFESGILDHRRGFAEPENLLVYDLGGGTFDVTVLQVDGWTMRALATDGDVRLGGRDCDERLADYIAARFLDQHGLDPRVDPKECAALWAEAERVKHLLSTRHDVNVSVAYAGLNWQGVVTRHDYDTLIADLLGRTESTLTQVLRATSLDWKDIRRVLLVGGATRMPIVSEMIARVTGKQPEATLSPDEAVARGAAIYAGMLLKTVHGSGFDKLQLINVNSHSLGIVGRNMKTGRRTNTIVIPRNTPLPASARKKFPLAHKGQTRVVIPVVEGETSQPNDCVQLGKCVIDDLPEGLTTGKHVVVEYTLDGSGLITVTAEIPGVRRGARVHISRDSTRSVQSLDTWCQQLLAGSVGATHNPSESRPEATQDALLRELDEQYIQLGQIAMLSATSEGIAEERRAAIRSFRELESARKEATRSETRQSEAVSLSERIEAHSDVARRRARVRELEQQYHFLLLDFGRTVLHNGITLPDSCEVVRNIERIQQLFTSREH